MFGRYTINIDTDLPGLLGGKGAGLFMMRQMGLPVPPAFVITVPSYHAFMQNGHSFLEGDLLDEIKDRIKELETTSQKRYGDPQNALLLSIRSGAPVSMPGMMDTVLNVGMNDEIREALAIASGDDDFAFQCHCRLLKMLGISMFGINKKKFEIDQEGMSLENVVCIYKQVVSEAAAKTKYPNVVDNVWEQLLCCIEGVLCSWHNHRAKHYRRIFQIPDSTGTAAIVQSMVFGNISKDSGTGVVFSRCPATGDRKVTGEYLMRCQGEDVVGGEAACKPIAMLEQDAPIVYRELLRVCRLLEYVYRDIQDVEFTFERGKLYILQTRSAKRCPQAMLKFLASAVSEQLISEQEAYRRGNLLRKSAIERCYVRERVVASDENCQIVGYGDVACPGIVRGYLAFSSTEVLELLSHGKQAVLLKQYTNPDDIAGIDKAVGMFTSSGGTMSHAAVVCRELGKTCIVNTGISINAKSGFAVCDKEQVIKRGDQITLDGSIGVIWNGNSSIERLPDDPDLIKFADWLLGK